MGVRELVTPLNQSFTASTAEAETLWTNGRDEVLGVSLPEFGRQSDDGRWLVRVSPVEALFNPSELVRAEAVCRYAYAEMQSLKGYAVDVISYAYTPVHDGVKVACISPWLEDISGCPRRLFAQHMAPKLLRYYQDLTEPEYAPNLNDIPARPFLWDFRSHKQCSVRRAEPLRPFIHDVEPHLSISSNEAHYSAEWHQLTMGRQGMASRAVDS